MIKRRNRGRQNEIPYQLPHFLQIQGFGIIECYVGCRCQNNSLQPVADCFLLNELYFVLNCG